ncbi:zinc metalloprotease [Nonomuraea sp. B12E4]|uniref:zinc metalloprotease n=1 Tax=Nonomuraea sp. B12E4 TaxID=3153564 RepID=UPI00325DDF98
MPNSPIERCLTMSIHRQLLARPEYVLALSALENATFARKTARAARRDEVVTIPIVVHVVHNTPEQDIGQDQIDSQITVVNQDFRKANPDVVKVPQVWRDRVADARLEFKLADADPRGNPTSGVVRRRTGVTEFGTDHEVKYADQGGSDAWPADRYLNVWVCQMRQALGYATFPGSPAEIDGVVIKYDAFGTTGTVEAPYDGGRTLTHEIGHWLNLRHIWGDDGDGCSGTDFVDDTPNQAGHNRGTPSYPRLSCGNGPDGDMFMNYMDYCDDASLIMFTLGQVERMDAALAGPRSTFLPQQLRERLRA